MKSLKVAYITAFLLIAILSSLKLVTVLFLTHQEGITQQYITLLSDQAVHSQRLQRNALLLLVPGNHRITDQKLQSDLDALERNHITFQNSYAASTSQLTAISAKTYPAYVKMIAAAHMLLALEHNTHLTQKARTKAELPYITTVFNDEDIHLMGLQQSIAIINAQSENYVTLVQALFWLNYGLTLLVLFAEGWLVLRPALRSFYKLEHEADTAPHEAVSPVTLRDTPS